MVSEDTIFALSTPAGAAARAVVRTSGPAAITVASQLTSKPLPHTASAAFQMLRFAGLVCPVWLYIFPSPRSYSGETTVEYHLPGNPVLVQLLLATLAEAGCRPAEPGEFTARAYFHGRLDLAQAEGVAAVIAAQSDRELAAARRLLAGELSQRLKPTTDRLIQALALLEVGIDFSDEDVSFISADDLRAETDTVRFSLIELLEQSARFEPLTHEPTFVLSGPPNAGKSTLLNALAGQERAVTSPIAGTTRDALSARVRLHRGWAKVVDVAGVEAGAVDGGEQGTVPPADGGSSVEAAAHVRSAMRRVAEDAIERADFVIAVLPADSPAALGAEIASPPGPAPALRVVTKIDLVDRALCQSLAPSYIMVSARTGEGLAMLLKAMDLVAFGASDARGERLALNGRHVTAVRTAIAAVDRAIRLIDDGSEMPIELVAAELREALDAIGAVQGRLSPDDLLGEIFSRFCIGK